MRKRLSIFFLAAGNTAYRLSLILAGMAAVQTAAFVTAMHRIDGSLDHVFAGLCLLQALYGGCSREISDTGSVGENLEMVTKTYHL